MHALRSARCIEQARLGEKDERFLRMLTLQHGSFRGGDLLERAAEVDGGSAKALGRFPRNGPVERPVHLVGRRSVAILGETMAEPRCEAVTCNCDQLAWGYGHTESRALAEARRWFLRARS